MVPIIDRYILREVLKTFFAIFSVILLVVLVQGYIRILQQAAVGAVDSRLVLSLVGLQVLEVVGPITPPTFFFSILYSLGRMYRDSEVTALAASGVGTFRIFRSYLFVAIPVALLVAYLTMGRLPWAKKTKFELVAAQQQQAIELSTSVAGRFNEYSQGDLVFYIENMSKDKTRLQNIFVQNRQNRKLGLITASEGYRYTDPETGTPYIVLRDGHRYEGHPGQNDYVNGDFDKYAIRIDEGKQSQSELTPQQLPTAQLIGSDDIRMRSELEYRVMLPISVLVFTLISIPLSKSLPRQGMYGSLILALLIYALFFNLQAISGGWMVSGATPPSIGRWWVHVAILLITAIVMILKSPDSVKLLRRLLKTSP